MASWYILGIRRVRRHASRTSIIHQTLDDERTYTRTCITPPPSSRACVEERDGQIYNIIYNTYTNRARAAELDASR